MSTNKVALYIIPGWGFTTNLLQFTSLNKYFDLVNLDYCAEENFSLNTAAIFCAQKIADNSIILAWSFGGLIAIRLATLFPNKIKKIIFLASQPKFLEEKNWCGIAEKDTKNFINRFNDNFNIGAKYFINIVNYPNKSLEHKKILCKSFICNKNILLPQLKILFNTDLRDEYKNIQAEILHIIGKNDAVVMQNSLHLKSLNPDINIVFVEEAGHSGFLTHEKIYQESIKNFVNVPDPVGNPQ